MEKRNREHTPIHSDSKLIIPNINHIPEFLKFVEWFSTPSHFRQPTTQKELARTIGVCEDTLTDWKKNPAFWTLVYDAIPEWIKGKVPDAIEGLFNRVMDKGSSKEVELFLRLGGFNLKNDKKI